MINIWDKLHERVEVAFLLENGDLEYLVQKELKNLMHNGSILEYVHNFTALCWTS